MTRTRAVGLVILVGGLVFGVAGGEYSTFDWLQLRREVRGEEAAIVRLDREIDSLGLWAVGLERDPAVQERVARERFGMLRPGELLFPFEDVPPIAVPQP